MLFFKKKKSLQSSACVGNGLKRRRPIVRDGCGAKLAVVKSKSGKYMVSVFVENHNHSLTTPQRRHLLRSHRSVSEVKKCLSQQFASVNIQTHQQISFFKIQAGGLQNMGCMEKDIYSHKKN